MEQMEWINRGCAVVILFSLCVAATFCAPRTSQADPGVYEVGTDPGLGFNLISWWGGTNASHWQNAVESIYDAGFREVSISPVRFVNMATGDIFSSATQSPSLTAIEAGVVRAKSLGMRVTLNPFVEPEGFSTWRGFYDPAPGSMAANEFWSDYQAYLLEVAAIGAEHGVDAMTVGTEYNAIDGNAGHNGSWSDVINAVDAVFSGQLGYAANWDHYNNSNVRNAIWEHPAIDFLGIDSYFPGLVSNSVADASGAYPDAAFLSAVTSAWTNKLENEILPFAAARKGGVGMPVVFTEVGYLPYNRTSRNPQNSDDQPVDTSEQIMAFNGLINALDGRGNEFHAMHVWQWHLPGSDGSLWNIDPTLPANQPNNVPLGQWLSGHASTATLPLAGDYNRDGSVNAADFTVWRDALGEFVLNYAAADGSGNGVVDGADYEVWKANFGSVSIDSGTALADDAVPEPSSFLVALAFFACIIPLCGNRDRGRLQGRRSFGNGTHRPREV